MATSSKRTASRRRPASEPAGKADFVLQAARTVFLTHGFSAATTDMIQREAHVSKSTVYALYPTKETLFCAVIERECRTFNDALRGIEFESDDIADSLTALARAYLCVVLSPMGLALYRVIVAEAPRFPLLARKFYVSGPRVGTATVAHYLERAAARGQIDVRAIGIDTASGIFMTLVRGEAHLECLTHPDPSLSEAQLDRWVRAAVCTFLLAFGTRGQTT